jgi:hypothetical protein
MLSNVVLRVKGRDAPNVTLLFRNVSSSGLVPNYEGDPMVVTAEKQVLAAGGRVVYSPTSSVKLLINNFDQSPQKEAVQQDQDGVVSYSFVDQYMKGDSILAFADSRYSNGADKRFVAYVLNATVANRVPVSRWAYAGWNTNGNTLGWAIAQAILLHTSKSLAPIEGLSFCEFCCPCRQADQECVALYLNVLRITEDRDWQANYRQLLRDYMARVPGVPYDDLGYDLPFY